MPRIHADVHHIRLGRRGRRVSKPFALLPNKSSCWTMLQCGFRLIIVIMCDDVLIVVFFSGLK